MAIRANEALAGGAAQVFKLVTAWLPEVTTGTERTSSGVIGVTRPIPIYASALDVLAQGGARAVEAARRTGWRYLVLAPQGALLVDLPDGDGSPTLTRGGNAAEKLIQAAALAEKIADVEVEYEVRILDLHPVAQTCLWLHRREGRGMDRFITLGRVIREVSGRRLLRRLKCRANAHLRSAEAPQPDQPSGRARVPSSQAKRVSVPPG